MGGWTVTHIGAHKFQYKTSYHGGVAKKYLNTMMQHWTIIHAEYNAIKIILKILWILNILEMVIGKLGLEHPGK